MACCQQMRILVIGAGVIGSVYAGTLAEAGNEVTLLARGDRLSELRNAGLRLRRVGEQDRRPDVAVVDRIDGERHDLVVLAVRREQAADAAGEVSLVAADAVMLFGNFAGLLKDLAAQAGMDRTIVGFPGVGGRLVDGSVEYVLVDQQPTMVGQIRESSRRAEDIAVCLRAAGFATRVEPDVEGWLGSHAALVVPLAAAIVAAAGSAAALSRRNDLLRAAARATRGIYLAQQRGGRLVINSNLRLLYLRMPRWFAVLYWARALRGEFGELAFAAHSRHAWTEMALLGSWLMSTLTEEREAADSLQRLLDLAAAAAPAGPSEIPLPVHGNQ